MTAPDSTSGSLTRRDQTTDRFTKRLERLGSEQTYVRIGGILALEQIVQDAPEQAAASAARVLGRFSRHRAPRAEPQPAPDAAETPLPEEPEGDGDVPFPHGLPG
ncbi:hypothetical protein [Streptomyces aureocirculatus]|uniref:hypothetical protein n=1 Tax=Streptomyces aureocirculatus TaxID=67275 RepID=UPI000AF271FE|nr:hypothetical protein [Streptomyces aureocirculatus]